MELSSPIATTTTTTKNNNNNNGRNTTAPQLDSFFPYISAATLTYTTAPYPFSLEPIWSSLFLEKQEEETARQNAKKTQQYLAQLQREEEEEQRLFRRGSSTVEEAPGTEPGAGRSRLAAQASRYYTNSLSAVQGWMQRAWTGVKTFTANRSVSYRQLCFTKLFARQLELLPPSAEAPAVYPASHVSSVRQVSSTARLPEGEGELWEEEQLAATTTSSLPPSSTNSREVRPLPPGTTVFVSVCCAIMSLGQPQVGTLFLTSEGFYFCSDVLLEREMNSGTHGSDSASATTTTTTHAGTGAGTPAHDYAALRRAYMENRKRSRRMWGTSNPASPSSSSEDEDEKDDDGYNSASTNDVYGLYDNSDDEGSPSTSQFLDGREVIKDWVPMADVASILPSIHLPMRIPKKVPSSPTTTMPTTHYRGGLISPPTGRGARGTPPPGSHGHQQQHDDYLYDYNAQDKYYYDGGFYFQGVPNLLVRPTSLQLFARQSRQLYQFIGMHSVVIKPPKRKSSAINRSTNEHVDLPSADMAVVDGDVLTWEEYSVLNALDGAYATFIVCVLAARLWSQQRRRQRWQQQLAQHVQDVMDAHGRACREAPCTHDVLNEEEEEEEHLRREEDEGGWLEDVSLLVLPDVEYAPPH